MLAEIITFAGIVCAGVLTEGAAGSGLSGCTEHSDVPLGSGARSAPPLPQQVGFLSPHRLPRCLDTNTLPGYLPVVLGTQSGWAQGGGHANQGGGWGWG